MVDIGAKLQELRQNQNLTLRALAAKVDVSPSMLSQIENGKANPSVVTLLNLAVALNVPIQEFFPDVAADGLEDDDLQADEIVMEMDATPLHPNAFPSTLVAEVPSKSGSHTSTTPVVHADARARIELTGGVTWERLSPGPEMGLEFLEVTYAPGGSSGPVMSRHNGREFGVVIEGELLLELGFERYSLLPGDSVAFNSSTPHRLSNPGTVKMRAIWVNA